MLLAYIWIGFVTIGFLFGQIRTFVNSIPEMAIALFDSSTDIFEFTRSSD